MALFGDPFRHFFYTHRTSKAPLDWIESSNAHYLKISVLANFPMYANQPVLQHCPKETVIWQVKRMGACNRDSCEEAKNVPSSTKEMQMAREGGLTNPFCMGGDCNNRGGRATFFGIPIKIARLKKHLDGLFKKRKKG